MTERGIILYLDGDVIQLRFLPFVLHRKSYNQSLKKTDDASYNECAVFNASNFSIIISSTAIYVIDERVLHHNIIRL